MSDIKLLMNWKRGEIAWAATGSQADPVEPQSIQWNLNRSSGPSIDPVEPESIQWSRGRSSSRNFNLGNEQTPRGMQSSEPATDIT